MRVNLDGRSCLGVLQPVTSLVSTLSLLKPQHQEKLLKKLVDPPLEGRESLGGHSETVSVPLSSKRQLSNKQRRKPRKAGELIQIEPQSGQEKEVICIHGALPESLPGSGQLGGILDRCDEDREKVTTPKEENGQEQEEEDRFVRSCASDCELYTGLQLLFRKKSNKGLFVQKEIPWIECTIFFAQACPVNHYSPAC